MKAFLWESARNIEDAQDGLEERYQHNARCRAVGMIEILPDSESAS